ncbi:Transcriptional regulatory protein sin3 [Serendipita sp. 411]|nr:Transcriptional regulatory protein sin3 [Serendipita sp. 411]
MDTSSAQNRPLNIIDALHYLDTVKTRFHDRPEVYNRFIDIMKDFKSDMIDTQGVTERVLCLFAAHNDLILGFNAFLPVGWFTETGLDGTITIHSPDGTTRVFPNRAPSLPYDA